MTGGPNDTSVRRRRGRAAITSSIVLVVGIALTMSIAGSVRAGARRDAQAEFRQTAQQTSAAMQRELATYFEKLRDIGAFQVNAPGSSAEAFRNYVDDTGVFEQLPSLVGVFFLARVEPADYDAFLANLEASGIPLAPSIGVTPPGSPHYFLTRYVPGAVDLELPVATDVSPITTLVEVIEKAGRPNEGAAGSFQNDPLIRKVAEQTDFELIDRLIDIDFFMGMPVFSPPGPDGRASETPIGWIGGPVDNFGDVVKAVSADLPSGIGLELTIDLTAVEGVDKGNLSRVAQQEGTAGPLAESTFQAPESFSLEGIDWRLNLWSPPGADADPAAVAIILVAGLVGSALGALLVFVRFRERDREREHAAEIAEREQFQGDILDSVTTPMVVLDGTGTILRTNPAWNDLVGRVGDAPRRRETDASTSYLAVMSGFVPATGSAALVDAVHGLLDGDADPVEVDVAFEDAGRRSWYSVRGTRIRGRRGGAVVIHTDITERKRSQEDLELKASHDDLTGLLNRAAFEEELNTALLAARTQATAAGIIYIDLDGFKPINDTYGHAAGDRVLREVSRRTSAAVRTSDRVARMGGDEFVVLVSPLNDRSVVTATAERILRALAKPITLDDGSGVAVSVMASIGVAVTDSPLDTSADDLLDRADQAMYASKQSGGACITLGA